MPQDVLLTPGAGERLFATSSPCSDLPVRAAGPSGRGVCHWIVISVGYSADDADSPGLGSWKPRPMGSKYDVLVGQNRRMANARRRLQSLEAKGFAWQTLGRTLRDHRSKKTVTDA